MSAVKSPVCSQKPFLHSFLFHCIRKGVMDMEWEEIFQGPLLKSFTEKFNI